LISQIFLLCSPRGCGHDHNQVAETEVVNIENVNIALAVALVVIAFATLVVKIIEVARRK
jgi:hypothetical protein